MTVLFCFLKWFEVGSAAAISWWWVVPVIVFETLCAMAAKD